MRMQISAIAAAMVVASPALAIEAFEAAPNPAAISAQAVSQLSAVQPVKLASGSKNGLSWTAVSRIIGQTATSDVLAPTNTIGGGNPIYKPSANKAGTVALIMEYANGSAFICSGTLMADGRSRRFTFYMDAKSIVRFAGVGRSAPGFSRSLTPSPLKSNAFVQFRRLKLPTTELTSSLSTVNVPVSANPGDTASMLTVTLPIFSAV